MSEIVVQIVQGSARETKRTFTTGTQLGPIGVGTGADWAVSAPNVAPVHAYLFFDGTTLYMSDAASGGAPLINGTPAGTDWTPVPRPSELRIGDAVLSVADAAAWVPPAPIQEDMATSLFRPELQAPPPPVPRIPAARPSRGRAPGGDEATAFLPIEEMRRDLAAAPPPAAGAPPPVASGVQPPAPEPPPPQVQLPPAPPSIGPADATAPPGQLPPTVAKPGESALLKAWREASPPRKAIYILLPFALIGSAFSLLQDDEPPPRTRTKSSASAKASAAPSASTSADPVVPNTAPNGPILPAVPTASGSTGFIAPKPGAPVPKKTLERRAVDAVAAGNYAEAADLYDQLVKERPDVPAYREALRIVQAKAKAAK